MANEIASMSHLMLRSKATHIYDYHNFDVTAHAPAFTLDEARLKKDMTRTLTAYGKKVSADTVETGDTVILSCRSENKRFQKENVAVVIGKGLFSRKLEAALVGMSVGTEKSPDISGVAVSVEVKDITRTILPELNDGAISALGIEGVSCVADLRRMCINKQIDRFLDDNEEADMSAALVCQTVAEKSTFELDPTEEAYITEAVKQKTAALGGTGNDEMSAMMVSIMMIELKTAVIGQKMLSETGEALTDADYEEVIRAHMEYDQTLTEARAKESYPIMEFILNRYADVLAKQVDAYVADCFRKIWNP